MRTLPEYVVESLRPAAHMREFRVLPYPIEKQAETKEKITRSGSVLSIVFALLNSDVRHFAL